MTTATKNEKTEEQTQALVKYEPNKPVGDQITLKALVNTTAMREAMRELAPKHLKPEKLARMVLSAASRNPTILKCTQASILKSAIEATMMGLDCSGLLGRGYLVPYYNSKAKCYEAQFMAGYLGLVDLARRSGEIDHIRTVPVFEGDNFDYEEGLDAKLIHKPSCDPEQLRDEEHLRWVYAIAYFKSGYRTFHVMSRAEVNKHRERSKAKDNGPWVTDYVPMALKTVTRQLCKFLPQSVDLQSQLAKEIEFDSTDEILEGVKRIEAELKPTNGVRQPFGFTGQESQAPNPPEGETQSDLPEPPAESPKWKP